MMPRNIVYHGTCVKNLKNICKRGLLKGTTESCSKYNKEAGFLEDCKGNVSLARTKKDALFFATISCMSKDKRKKGELSPQAILTVNLDELTKGRIVDRDMFGNKSAEIKYFGDIPSSAIEDITIRVIRKSKKPEEIDIEHGCPEYLARCKIGAGYNAS